MADWGDRVKEVWEFIKRTYRDPDVQLGFLIWSLVIGTWRTYNAVERFNLIKTVWGTGICPECAGSLDLSADSVSCECGFKISALEVKLLRRLSPGPGNVPEYPTPG
jgi:hypothetical protein